MPAIADLVGILKQNSDLVTRPMRIRYTDAVVITPGTTFRQTFPRVADDILDLRSIKIQFDLNLIGDTKLSTYVDAASVQAIFNRVRVISGSTVVADIVENGLLCSVQSLMHRSTSDNPYDLYLAGREPTQVFEAKRTYVSDIGPRGAILNCNGVLPLSRMSDLHVDITLEAANRCLKNVNGEAVSYTISNVRLQCDYLRSNSLSQYFNQNPVSFHVTDYTSRLSVFNSQIAMARFSSNHSSLNAIVTVMRNQARLADMTAAGKFQEYVSGADIESYNCFMNSTMLFDQAISSSAESFSLLKKAFPVVKHASWYDNNYQNWKFLIAIPLQAAPASFADGIQSGIDTTAMNSDAVLQVNFKAVPVTTTRVDSFLISDSMIYLENGRGDLRVRY